LSGDDRLRRDIIMQLICHFYLDIGAVESTYGIRFASYFADALPRLLEMQEDRLIAISGAVIEVLPKGRLLIRNICMVFDRYLNWADAAPAAYSRVL
jgi:oxygen-independent coproporphyrinogen-3 oxidase